MVINTIVKQQHNVFFNLFMEPMKSKLTLKYLCFLEFFVEKMIL